ncbi:hypothetical protein [Yinghuangia soli]|uniref:Uncharacterized protein n=1 Tax=Yinghuangia soli TaxID=2908204 RepID=A0AA41U6Y2_9ACTN|nr:hypothetical protein [Yinghuangia soli]MCF2533492.1 hypothetical protein [Yinghuangia soli]
MNAEPDPAQRPARTARRIPAPAAWAAAVAAAWFIPDLTHVLGADLLLVALVVLGLASLLRAGGNLVDRIMLAVGLAGGLAIAGGLVFSVWPWHLEPVPIARCALLGLVGTAWLTGRRPRLPKRVLGSDLILIGAAAAAWLSIAWPTLGRTFEENLDQFPLGWGGDRLRHYGLYDAIQHVGGYTFLHAEAARPFVHEGMETNYPSGAHYLYTLLDHFLRSTADPGTSTAEFAHYYWYTTVGLAFLVLAVVWSVRWAAGPLLAGWPRALVCAGVGAYMVTGPMMSVFPLESDAETIGLAWLAMLTAVLARPPARTREQIVLVAALVVATAFSYSMFLAVAAGGVLLAGYTYRRRLVRHRVLLAVSAVVSVPVAALPILVPRFVGHMDTGRHLLLPGGTVNLDRRLLLALLAVLAICMAVSPARRIPPLRLVFGLAGLTLAGLVAFWAFQTFQIGRTVYYFEKALHAWLIVMLVGTGAIGIAIRRIAEPPVVARRLAPPLRRTAAAATAAALGVLLVGGISWGKVQPWSGTPSPGTTWAASWRAGSFETPYKRSIQLLYHHGLLADGKPTLVLLDRSYWNNLFASMFVADLNHGLGVIRPQISALEHVKDIAPPRGKGEPAPWTGNTGEQCTKMRGIVASTPVPLRIVLSDGPLADCLAEWSVRPEANRLHLVRLNVWSGMPAAEDAAAAASGRPR